MTRRTHLAIALAILAVLGAAGSAVAFTAADISQTDNESNGTPTDSMADGSAGNASNLTAEAVVERARASYADIEDFTAVLTSTSTFSEETVNTTANFSFKRPDKVRFEFRAPKDQAGNLIVSNGTNTVFYNAPINSYRVLSSENASGMESQGGQPGLSVGYFDALNRTFDVSKVTFEGTATVNGRETFVLSLQPQREGGSEVGTATGGSGETRVENGIESGPESEFSPNITLFLDQETYIPIERRSTTSFGNDTTSTVTRLRNLSVNVGLSDEHFEFDPPSNATLVGGSIPETAQYDSIEATQENAPIEVCAPTEVPGGYSFDQSSVTSTGENTTSVSLTYTNGSGPASALRVNIASRGPENATGGMLGGAGGEAGVGPVRDENRSGANKTPASGDSATMGGSNESEEMNEMLATSDLAENVTVKGGNGTFIGGPEGAGGAVIFEFNGFQYSVSGPFGQEELVAIADSIECADGGTQGSETASDDGEQAGSSAEDSDQGSEDEDTESGADTTTSDGDDTDAGDGKAKQDGGDGKAKQPDDDEDGGGAGGNGKAKMSAS